MATREKRLAQFDGNGMPPPDQPVEVLCEDHSGTYQLPFACRMVAGQWRNHESGITVEATGLKSAGLRRRPLYQNATGCRRILRVRTRSERIAPESLTGRRTPLFTARYRLECHAAHHMQHDHNGPQPAAKHKG